MIGTDLFAIASSAACKQQIVESGTHRVAYRQPVVARLLALVEVQVCVDDVRVESVRHGPVEKVRMPAELGYIAHVIGRLHEEEHVALTRTPLLRQLAPVHVAIVEYDGVGVAHARLVIGDLAVIAVLAARVALPLQASSSSKKAIERRASTHLPHERHGVAKVGGPGDDQLGAVDVLLVAKFRESTLGTKWSVLILINQSRSTGIQTTQILPT